MSNFGYGNDYRNNGWNNHYKKYKTVKEGKKPYQQSGFKEVEINSIEQTEPSKTKQNSLLSSESNDISLNMNKTDIIHLNNEDFGMKEVNENMKLIISKLEELDIEKKVCDITTKINEKYSSLKDDAIESLKKIKSELENKIEFCNQENLSDMREVKSLLNWQCQNDLRNHLNTLKGEYYSKPLIITSVYDFEKYYDSILSNDLRDKFIYKKSFSEIIHLIYEAFKFKNDLDTSLDEKFWYLVNYFNNGNKKQKTKLKLNLSGSLYRIIKHFRGVPDDIIIEFGDLIPIINSENTIVKAKKKIYTVVSLLTEIFQQMSEIKNSIYVFGHIYYGSKDKDIEIKEELENDVYYDFVELK